MRPRHLLPRRGSHDERDVPGRVLLPDADGEARAVPRGYVLPAGFDGPCAVRGGHVERRDRTGGGVRFQLRSGALLRGRINT